MARILVDGEWYSEIALASLYETEFEQIFIEQAASLYPEYHAVKFRQMVFSETDAARPDFALIDKEYLEWWVVEVEMSHHPFNAHVLPQVRTLSQGAYGKEHAERLCSELPSLDRQSMLDMMKGKQPRVLVIVDAPQPEWATRLSHYGAFLAVFQIFRSDKNRHIFRINGEHPKRLVGVLSKCTFDAVLPRLLRVDSPAGLGIPPNGRVKIMYESYVTEWWRVDSQDSVWLHPISANPLLPKEEYELIRLSDGSLEIRLVKTRLERRN